MTLLRHKISYKPLSDSQLDDWRSIPAAIVGDSLNRARCLDAGIKSLTRGTRLVGQARTVQVPAGDNAAIHVAVALAAPNEILVIDACAHPDTAVWGDILTTAARKAGLGGVILDGAVRDAAEIIENGFPVFCRAISPRGPQKGSFGMIDGSVAVGGVSVASGDLIIADDDGVAIVPYDQISKTLSKAKNLISKEAEIIAAIESGRSSAELLGITIPDPTD